MEQAQQREASKPTDDFEARVNALTRLALDAVVMMDAEGRITEWNPRAEITFGWSREEAMGRLLSDTIIPARYQEAHRRGLRRLLDTGGKGVLNKRMEIEAVHRDGREFPVDLAISAVHSGGVWTFVAFVRDTSARKRVEEALAEETEVLYTLMDNTQDSIYFKDVTGRFTRINRAHAQALGISDPTQALGKTDGDFFDRDFAEAARADEQQIIQSGVPLVSKMERVRRNGAEEIWYSTTKVILNDSQRRVAGILGVSRDITQFKRVQEELQASKLAAEAASRAKSEFLANMSHEIRTPMNGVIGMTELALETELTQDQRHYLNIVKASADSLLTVINDILDFSKIEAGKLDIDPVEFSLRDCLRLTMETLALRASVKGLELACDVSPELPDEITGDPTRLRQILVNLIGNAIKFTERGEVVLGVESESQAPNDLCLHFTLSDTGVGIPQDKQKFVFEAFAQADGSTVRRYGGTGLGLTISSRLVQLMRGKIWVESEPGKGSKFHFTAHFRLPTDPAKKTTPSGTSLLRNVAVLVVDDNAANRRILHKMLVSFEMRPIAVDGGVAALDALQRAADAGRPFPLVILDAHMPELDGFTMAEMIKENPGLAGATIMLTSAGQRGDADRCREIGVAAYLTKPVHQSEVWEEILRVLGGHSEKVEAPSLLTRHSLRQNRTRCRILLGEDNAVNREIVVRLLEKWGNTVVAMTNGREVLAALEGTSEAFDLLLMDVQMPELDGFETTAAIRMREKVTGAHLPIIAMTARAMKGDRELCLEAGMDGYITKPIQTRVLFDIIESIGSILAKSRPGTSVGGTGVRFLDSEALLSLVGGDENLLSDIIGIFLNECTELMAAMREAIERRDAKALGFAAHSFKGSAGNFAVLEPVDLAMQLEALAGAGDLEGAESVFQELQVQVDRLRLGLEALLKNLAR